MYNYVNINKVIVKSIVNCLHSSPRNKISSHWNGFARFLSNATPEMICVDICPLTRSPLFTVSIAIQFSACTPLHRITVINVKAEKSKCQIWAGRALAAAMRLTKVYLSWHSGNTSTKILKTNQYYWILSQCNVKSPIQGRQGKTWSLYVFFPGPTAAVSCRFLSSLWPSIWK